MGTLANSLARSIKSLKTTASTERRKPTLAQLIDEYDWDVTASEALEQALEVIAEEDDKFSENNPDRLKVLTDPDAQKLVMKLYQQYISEEDFSTLVMFIKDFDNFLGKYRDRPLTKQEIDKIEQQQGDDDGDEDVLPKKKKKGRKRAKTEEDLKVDFGDENPDPEIETEPEVEGDKPEDETFDEEPSITISKTKTTAASRIASFLSSRTGK